MAHAAVLRVLRRTPTTPTTVHAIFAGLGELEPPVQLSSLQSVTRSKEVLREMLRLAKVETVALEGADLGGEGGNKGGGVKGNRSKARYGFVPSTSHADGDGE